MRRRDFILGTGALVLSGSPTFAQTDKGALAAAQARLNSTLVTHLRHGKGENIVVSPASLTAILAVLALGTDDKMQAAIHKCLGLDALTGAAASAGLAAVRSQLRDVGLAREEQGATFTLANLIVIDPKSQPHMPVVEQLRAGAEVMIDDLSKLATINQINAWVSGQTKGFIRKVFDSPPRAAGLTGVNALYFKGLWKDRFDSKLTQMRPFHALGGGGGEVPLMARLGSYSHRQEGRFVAVDLPYRNDRFALVVATTSDRPAAAAEFSSVAGWLAGEGFEAGRVDLSLPRFTLSEGADVLDALDAAGLKAGRASPTAFAPLSPVALSLTRIVQQTYLRVDEEGTEAAATTAVTVSRAAAIVRTVKIVVDKPFVFALRDRQSGLFLLSGYVGRPQSKTVS